MDKRILLAGCAGSIGAELYRQLAPDNKVFGLDNNESGLFDILEEMHDGMNWAYGTLGDIRSKKVCKDVFSDFKPEIVINAAALKHVSMSQVYPREYVETNIMGNLNLIEEAKKWDCMEKFVFISTDKAVASKKNVMGATKMCSETITAAMGDKFMAVRFGNVMNSRGSVLEIWRRQHDAGQPITITDPKMMRYMMTIPQACSLVVEAMNKGKGGEVWCLDMGELRSIMELKEDLYGKDYPVKMIGSRPGESMSEEIMTVQEKARAIKQGKFWIIR